MRTAAQRATHFPKITLWDNVACQHTLLTEHLHVSKIALVAGWSMAGCQAYQWAAQYPKYGERYFAILCFSKNFAA